MGFGYSKEQVPAGAVPKGFDGLLHPQLKGKMGITLNESSARMIGAMIKIKGEAFVKKLKAQEIRIYTVSSAALVDLMASGELGASFHIYRNHAMVSAERGSPAGWVPMELVPTKSGCVGLAAQPPHPHAATLFVDFHARRRSAQSAGEISIRPSVQRHGRSNAGIPASVERWNNLKKTATSGKSSPRKSPRNDNHLLRKMQRCKSADLSLIALPTRSFAARALALQARKPKTISELVTYNGKDREAVLYARREERRQSHLVHLACPANRTRAWSKPSKPSIPA